MNQNNSPQRNTDYFYRPIESKADKSFVIDAWMKGYKNSDIFKQFWSQKHNEFMPHFLYWKYQKMLILDLIGNGNTILICGENKTDLYGFINYEIESPFLIIHWIYLKKDFRGFGLAKELISELQSKVDPSKQIIVTHLSNNISLDKKRFAYLPTWRFSFDDDEEGEA